MKKHTLFGVLSLMCLQLFAQEKLTGVILGKDNLGVLGANVYWLNTSTGTTTNEKGAFKIPYKKEYEKLIVSFIGFKTDTIEINSLTPIKHFITESNELEEVLISAKKKPTAKSYLATQNIFIVNSDELLKLIFLML